MSDFVCANKATVRNFLEGTGTIKGVTCRERIQALEAVLSAARKVEMNLGAMVEMDTVDERDIRAVNQLSEAIRAADALKEGK